MSTKKLQIIGNFGGNSIEIDDTLTITGKAADAKATGDAINQLQTSIDEVAGRVGDFGGEYYTESEIDSMMADLNASIDSKSDVNHAHDDLYYTEAEIDGMMADLNAVVDAKSDADHVHDDLYYAKTEIDDKFDDIQSDIDSKVDAVDGMGLSTNDYTTAEKDKLATIEDNANFYEHPTHDSHISGLYKVTVDESGHVSGAALVKKEDIVALGIPAQDTTYEEEISDLSDRIDDVENSINTTNETLEGVTQEFESYKTTNNEAVSTNASGIEANKAAIEAIQSDYLTSTDKTQLQDDISKVSEKATANASAIEVLNGEGEGSVKQSIDNAFNEFAANVTNDDVINTYKELIDYAATHGPEFTKLVGKVDTIDIHVGEIETDLSNYKTAVSDQFTEVDTTINNHVTDTNNPHNVTKGQIGLDQVDNTSDLDKPISHAVDEALQGKADLEHIHEIGEVNSLQDLLDELRVDIDTNAANIDTKADSEHTHNDLYYTKDEILESITVDDIDDICDSNVIIDGGNSSVVSYATKRWVQDGYQPKGNYLTSVPDGYATESYVDTKISAIQTADVPGQINAHNLATDAHNDIRLLVNGLTTRLNTLADCDDTTLDQMSEVVEYIKNNQSLIEGITTKKVNVADIIDNLTTNVSNKPLSAAQGVVLNGLIEELTNNLSNYQPKGDYLTAVPAGYATEEFVTAKIAEAELSGEEVDLSGYATKDDIPTKVSELENDSKYLTSYTETDPTVPAWAKAEKKPTYTADEVGLGNVDNVKQYSAENPPFVAQPEAPSDTSLLWLDTDDDSSESGGGTGPSGGGIDVTAEVGQTIIVEEVDGTGKPTKWKAVDYQQRTHYSTFEEVQLLDNVTFSYDIENYVDFHLVAGQSYRVICNGTVYEDVAQTLDVFGTLATVLGNAVNAGFDDNEKPYCFLEIAGVQTMYNSAYCTDDTISLYTNQETAHQIPKKYVPDMGPFYMGITMNGADVATTESIENVRNAYNSGRQIILKVFTDTGFQFYPMSGCSMDLQLISFDGLYKGTKMTLSFEVNEDGIYIGTLGS